MLYRHRRCGLDWRQPISKLRNGRETYTVVFAPEAEDNLVELYAYIAGKASSAIAIAKRYTAAIVDFCEGLATFPHRGTRRDDVRPGLRITHHRRRAMIAFEVNDEVTTVSVLGIFYGGRDYEVYSATPTWQTTNQTTTDSLHETRVKDFR